MAKNKIRTTNTGLKNISKHKATGKYEVRVNVKDNSKSQSFYIGLAKTKKQALEMRKQFILNLL